MDGGRETARDSIIDTPQVIYGSPRLIERGVEGCYIDGYVRTIERRCVSWGKEEALPCFVGVVVEQKEKCKRRKEAEEERDGVAKDEG